MLADPQPLFRDAIEMQGPGVEGHPGGVVGRQLVAAPRSVLAELHQDSPEGFGIEERDQGVVSAGPRSFEHE